MVNHKVLDRRTFFSFLGCWSAVFILSGDLRAQQHSVSPRLPDGIGSEPDYSGPLPSPADVLGRERAKDPEIQVAKEVLAKAPTGVTPFRIAHYFADVGDGAYGEAWRPYVKGWPVRWNPVIVTFFQATQTVPMGDETSWCAAFVNWCFQRASKGFATNSASSGSFRSFGTQTDDPRVGDLVVFQKTLPKTKTEEQQGHVAFFVANHGDQIEVLGGNQIVGHERSHMICSRLFAKKGSVLTLNSYRTDQRLH
jgi:uncharacterized protein (TIGR02594 family)